MLTKRLHAFTLTELVIAFAIMGILVLLAFPKLMPLISKAKSTEAQLQLSHLHMLQKAYFYTHSEYSTSFDDLGFEHETMVDDGGSAQYVIEIKEAGSSGFLATATAVKDFDGDGVYNVWEVDQDKKLKEVVKD